MGIRFIQLLFALSLTIASQLNITASNLEEDAKAKIDILNQLITELEAKGIETQDERLAVRTAEVFLFYANWDEANMSLNTEYYKKVTPYKEDAATYAANLASFERNDVIKLLDESIAYAQKLNAGEVKRKASPVVDWANVKHEGNQLTLDDKPVFVADYTWKLDKAGPYDLTEYFGQLDGFFLSPKHSIAETGEINSNIVHQIQNKETGKLGFIFINNSNVADWTKTKYGDAFTQFKGEPFTNYDIDHPGAKVMMGNLIEGTTKYMQNKNYTGLGYMLCNEPRWINYKDGNKKVWYNSGVSEYTMDKFRTWLSTKHSGIQDLNALWNTSFADFESVELEIPIDISLMGTPQWYDYNTFNDQRVLDYYTWMKATLLENDPNAKTHFKIMPSFFTDNDPCTGIDLEALTEMSDINGNDCAAQYNNFRETPEWSERYQFGWRELFMGYDFLKSVKPDQINFNSESHLLTTGHTRDLHMDPKFARAIYWLAHTLGLNASQTWYWPRREDGSIRTPVSNGYAGSNNQQPRVTKELHSTILDLNRYPEEIMAMQTQHKPIRIFYSKTSAHQKAAYMDHIYELYEELNFEGIPLGFATKNIISKQSHSNWDVILLHNTNWITKAERDTLQSYLNNGGIIISDASSIEKDEYGRAMEALVSGNGRLIKVASIAEMKTKALEILATNSHLPEVNISEENASDHKTCTWKCVKNEAGNNVISITNMGKGDAKITIELKNASKGTTCFDLLKGIHIKNTPILKPYEVLLIEVTDQDPIIGIWNISRKQDHFSVEVYPNPNSGVFKVSFDKMVSDGQLNVIDATGRSIQHQSFNNRQTVTVNMQPHLKGLFLIHVLADGTRTSSRFLKE